MVRLDSTFKILRIIVANVVIVSMSMLAANNAFANDPCNFRTTLGSQPLPFLMPDQVMACYNSVPVDPNVDVAEYIADALEVPKQSTDLAPFYKDSGFPLFMKVDLSVMQNELRSMQPQNDFELHQSAIAQLGKFKNTHWGYEQPLCYKTLQPFIPIILGSRLDMVNGQKEQVVFVKDNWLNSYYYQIFTGIDTNPLVGQTIVSINGVPALEAIKKYADRVGVSPFSSVNFAFLISGFGYTAPWLDRGMPSDLSPIYTFKDDQGNLTDVTIPWIFLPRELIFGPQSVVGYPSIADSAQEQIASCRAPWDIFTLLAWNNMAIASGDSDREHGISGLTGFDKEMKIRKQAFKYLKETAEAKKPKKDKPNIRNKKPALPFTLLGAGDEISYGQLGDKTTVIKIESFSPSDGINWIYTLNTAVEHACENSKNVILDYTGNGGGSLALTGYLVSIFNPDIENSGKAFPYQVMFPDPSIRPLHTGFLLGVLDTLSYVTGLPCLVTSSAGCSLRSDGSVLPFWSDALRTQGLRGKQTVDLTELLRSHSVDLSLTGLPQPKFCPGKFKGKKLVQLFHSNLSGGAQAVKGISKYATNIAYHGILGEPVWFGGTIGGNVEYYFVHTDLASDLVDISFPVPGLGSFVRQFTIAPIPVKAALRFERYGMLDGSNPANLLIATLMLPDKRLHIWDIESLEDLEMLYTEALNAAKHVNDQDRAEIYTEYLRWAEQQE